MSDGDFLVLYYKEIHLVWMYGKGGRRESFGATFDVVMGRGDLYL